jgi:predicted RNA methylase
VKKFIGNRFTHMLPDQKKSSLGKYYSPTGAIRLVRALLKGILNPSDLVLDICVGCGAFAFEFAGNEFYGFDIDPVAVQILKKMGFKLMVEMDSLACVDRARFDIANPQFPGRPPHGRGGAQTPARTT